MVPGINFQLWSKFQSIARNIYYIQLSFSIKYFIYCVLNTQKNCNKNVLQKKLSCAKRRDSWTGLDISSVQSINCCLSAGEERRGAEINCRNQIKTRYYHYGYFFHKLFIFKGNMHHKYDVSSKVAFYIKDLAAGIIFEKFES